MAGTRAKRPEIKITVKDYNNLVIYCKGKEGISPTKIVGNLVSDFLEREDVKKDIAENSVSVRKKKQIEKKKEQLEKLKAEIEELEKATEE
jgi:hypothetical protein